MADLNLKYFESSTIQYSELESGVGRKFNKDCVGTDDVPFIKVGSVNGVFRKTFLQFYERIRDFSVRPDDIWVVTFPKCGTTWTQEMVWLIMNDLDFEGAKVSLSERFPYFENQTNWFTNNDQKLEESKDNKEENCSKVTFRESFEFIENLPSPRFIKSHLHFSLLPNGMKDNSAPKIIYTARNPKDVCASLYFHDCLFTEYKGTKEDFVEAFITNNVNCSPYWTHLKVFWEIRDRPNILFLKYEDMKKDLPSIIRKTAKFLGKTLTEEQINSLEKHLSFENMKDNPAVNYSDLVENRKKAIGGNKSFTFLRKGKVGSWKEDLSPEMAAKLDAWTEENKIDGLYNKPILQ